MEEIYLKVDFATLKNEFAVAEQSASVAYNLSKMDFLNRSVDAERLKGKAQSQLISVFGRWVVVFILVQSAKGNDQSTMLFFDLDIDLSLLEEVNEGQEELQKGVIRAMADYKKVFDPKVHDFVRLVLELPS